MLIKDYLGYFLPLAEQQNEVWVTFKSDGKYKIRDFARQGGNPPEMFMKYWEGKMGREGGRGRDEGREGVEVRAGDGEA